MSSNKADVEAITAVCTAALRCHMIEKLDVSDNGLLSLVAAEALVAMFNQTRTLRTVIVGESPQQLWFDVNKDTHVLDS